MLASSGDVAAGVVAELTKGGVRLFAETAADGTFAFKRSSRARSRSSFRTPSAQASRGKSATVIGSAVDLGDVLLDDAPPVVVGSTPDNGALGVSRPTDLRVRFGEAVSAATVNDATLTLTGPDGKITGQVDLRRG